ncbi:hypothetical protein C8Q74DRAFT_505526 [Fomes fomentarius]|nr:hypothetical protein C8Q74DRAFT_505526 [Fomes fomentarius]
MKDRHAPHICISTGAGSSECARPQINRTAQPASHPNPHSDALSCFSSLPFWPYRPRTACAAPPHRLLAAISIPSATTPRSRLSPATAQLAHVHPSAPPCQINPSDELALSMTLVRTRTTRAHSAQEPPASQEVEKHSVAVRMAYASPRARLSVISQALRKRSSTQHGPGLPRLALALSRTSARGTWCRCPDVGPRDTSSARPRPHPPNARARVYGSTGLRVDGSTGWRAISSPRACVNVLSVLIISPSFTKPIKEDEFRHLPG